MLIGATPNASLAYGILGLGLCGLAELLVPQGLRLRLSVAFWRETRPPTVAAKYHDRLTPAWRQRAENTARIEFNRDHLAEAVRTF